MLPKSCIVVNGWVEHGKAFIVHIRDALLCWTHFNTLYSSINHDPNRSLYCFDIPNLESTHR